MACGCAKKNGNTTTRNLRSDGRYPRRHIQFFAICTDPDTGEVSESQHALLNEAAHAARQCDGRTEMRRV